MRAKFLALKCGGALLLAFTILGVASFISPQKAEARSGSISSVTFPNPEASDPSVPLYLTIGAGEFDGSIVASIISTDAPGTVGIIIDDGQWCNDPPPGGVRGLDLPNPTDGNVPMFSTAYNVSGLENGTINLSGGPRSRTDSSTTEQCANRNMSMSFEMVEADRNPDTGVYSVVFWAYGVRNTGSPAYGAAENSFRISVGGAAGARATFMPKSPSFDGAFFNLSNRNHASNTYAYYSVDFTPACSVLTDREVNMQFYDVDNGTYQNTGSYPALTYNFQEGPVGSITGQSPVYVKFGVDVPRPNPGVINGGNGQTSDKLYSKINGSHTYRLTIDGLTYINAISYTIDIPLDVLSAARTCGGTAGTCSITEVVNLYTGGAVHPGEPIKFKVVTNGVSGGRQLGVNGPSYGGEASGNFGNYLVGGNQFARGSPEGVYDVTIPAHNGILPATGTTQIDDMMFGTSGEGSLQLMYAPGSTGDFAFNWGLVDPGVSWNPVTKCGGTMHVEPNDIDNATCVGYSVNTAPIHRGSTFSVTVSFRNDGNTVWYFSNYQPGATPSLVGNFNGEERSWADPGRAVNPGEVVSYTITRTAPNSFGTFPFGWKMIHETAGRWFGGNCDGNITVVPRNITIQGRLFDAEDMTISYGGIGIYTCTGQTPYTDGNGNYSFVIQEDSGFCIRANTWPAYSESAGVRPGGEGYLDCPAYGSGYSSPNYCTKYSTYEWQMAGGRATTGESANFDRTSNTGYDIAFVIQKVTVQGTVMNAYNMGAKYAGVNIATCVAGLSATSNAAGNWSFIIRRGWGYCINPSNYPAGTILGETRPWGDGYGACPAYSSAQPTPNYCIYGPQRYSYQYQRAGEKSTEVTWRDHDRTSDTGFDFALRFAPKISCTLDNGGAIEAGVPNNYQPKFYVKDIGASTDAPVDQGGTGNMTTTGVGSSTGTFTALSRSAGDTLVTMNPASFTINTPATYAMAGNASATGDFGLGTGTIPCGGSTSVIASFYPYVKSYGSDVSVGGSYSCGSTDAGVYAWANGDGVTARGSSNQLSVMSLLNIKGFFSASSRTAEPIANKGLSFSNTGGGSYGGNFGGSSTCMPDYFGSTQDTSLTGNLVSPSEQVYVPAVAAVAAVPAVPATPAIPARAAVPATPGRPYIAPTPYIPAQYARYNYSPYANVGDSWPAPYPAYWGPPGFYGYNALDGNIGTDWAVSGVPTRYVGDYEGPAYQPGAVYLYVAWPFYMQSDRIVLHDRTNGTDQITSGRICFSDYNNGWCVPFGTLENYGSGYELNFPMRSFTAITVRIDSVAPGTLNTGLSDMEVYYTVQTAAAQAATPGQSYIAPTPYIPAQPYVPANPGSPAIPGVVGVPAHYVPRTYAGGTSRYVVNGSGTEVLGEINIPNGSQIATYVDHNVYITKNIQYGTGARGSKSDIPFFALVVRGNIYIDPSVTRLDGLYIAQPRNLTQANPPDGRIYTCAPGGAKPTAANIYTACNTQLTVNGSLIAQQIKFFRTMFSLKDSSQREVPDFATGQGSHAAETINYSPEMYLAPSPLRAAGSQNADSATYKKYDAIFSLPPVY